MKPRIMTNQEILYHINEPKKIKQVKAIIALEKYRYKKQHEKYVNAIQNKYIEDYLSAIKNIKYHHDRKIAELEDELMNLYKPTIKFSSTTNKYYCGNNLFHVEYGEVLLGVGDTVEESYEDWLKEMEEHNFEATYHKTSL